MSTIRSLSSPTPEEDSMSFNLFRGRSTGKLRALNTFSPSEIFWDGRDLERFDEELHLLKEKVARDYEEEYNDCFADDVITVRVKKSGSGKLLIKDIYFGTDTYAMTSLKLSDQVDAAEEFNFLLTKPGQLTAICVGLELDEFSHAMLLIINKLHATVELYDPNGYEHIYKYFPEPMDNLRYFLIYDCGIRELEKYRFCSVEENSPYVGLQSLGARFGGYEERFIKQGMCQTWVFLLAALRAQYASVEPSKFKKRIKSRIDSLRARATARGATNINARTGQHLMNYLLEFLTNTRENISYKTKSTLKRKASSEDSGGGAKRRKISPSQ